MKLDNLIERCEFDFSRASKAIKDTVLTVAMVVSSANAMAAPSNVAEEYLQKEQASFTESIEADSNQLSAWNYMLERNGPDDAGSAHLDKMEAMGAIQTPITFSEYAELANPEEGDFKVDVFRNPLAKDGIIVMSTSTFYEKMNAFEALFEEPQFNIRPDADALNAKTLGEWNEWRQNKPTLEETRALKSELNERIMDVVGGLDNMNMKYKFGTRALGNVVGGYDSASYMLLKDSVGGFNSGVAMNGGSSAYFDDGNAKITMSALYSGGSSAMQWGEVLPVIQENIDSRSTVEPYVADFIKKDLLPIDREAATEMPMEDKLKVANTITLMHETFHGVLSYSTSSAQPSMMFNAFNQAYNDNLSDTTDLSIGKVHVFDMGAYRLNHESACDMAALTIAASGASDQEWEYAKFLNESIRKQSFVDNHLFSKGTDSDYTINPNNVKRLGVEEFDDANFMANHDVAFLVNGWAIALDEARNGEDPNNLLALANEPLKLGMAVQYANAVVMSDLAEMTNDWESMPKDQYEAFVLAGTEKMQEYVQSAEFAHVLESLDTEAFEPNLGMNAELGVEQNLSNDIEQDLAANLEVDKPKNRAKLTM